MALNGIKKSAKLLAAGCKCKDAILTTIKDVEDNPEFASVGYGGLPNKDMVVECDAAYMNGDDFSIGAVGSLQDIASPIELAELLSHEKTSNFLVGQGAKKYALNHHLQTKNMLTESSKEKYYHELNFTNPYRGHDTIGCLALDSYQTIVAATSTSGLFLKEPGRVGDSPLVGSGYYADSNIGACAATGLGEDIMKGCMSYRVVSYMANMPIEQALEKAMREYLEIMKKRETLGDCSLIALNKKGEYAGISNIADFAYVVASENLQPTLIKVKKFSVD